MQMQTVPNEEKSNLFLQASVSKVAKKLTDRDKGKKINFPVIDIKHQWETK